ncbi:MAG TPA: type II secretion system protein [Candidatus Saccharibacteria bacterium]|nr:type II secretion system protein [Candidatus Saccharibacteria bacterium]HMT39924.1 type II secretion system protein [Candidatus Saccharibacteria bacterium]
MKKLSNKGFTLIEVVIVLAIASLIMVIVFLAVQGANRAQRDTARKNQANQILAAAQQFAANNSGKFPQNQAEAQTLFTEYQAPNTGLTATNSQYALGKASNEETAYLFMSIGKCQDGAVVSSSPSNSFAVSIYQEAGGAYCISDKQ